jgi:hypothetical protein
MCCFRRPPSREVSLALRRLQSSAATCTGVTSPGCATSSSFLCSLTRYSALNLAELFHPHPPLGFHVFRGFPPETPDASLDDAFPSCSSRLHRFIIPALVRRSLTTASFSHLQRPLAPSLIRPRFHASARHPSHQPPRFTGLAAASTRQKRLSR